MKLVDQHGNYMADTDSLAREQPKPEEIDYNKPITHVFAVSQFENGVNKGTCLYSSVAKARWVMNQFNQEMERIANNKSLVDDPGTPFIKREAKMSNFPVF